MLDSRNQAHVFSCISVFSIPKGKEWVICELGSYAKALHCRASTLLWCVFSVGSIKSIECLSNCSRIGKSYDAPLWQFSNFSVKHVHDHECTFPLRRKSRINGIQHLFIDFIDTVVLQIRLFHIILQRNINARGWKADYALGFRCEVDLRLSYAFYNLPKSSQSGDSTIHSLLRKKGLNNISAMRRLAVRIDVTFSS